MLKIAILPSFTFDGIEKYLKADCARVGLGIQIYLGKYGQHLQEILDKGSGLYQFAPEVIIVFIDLQSFWGEDLFSRQNVDDGGKLALISQKEQEIKNLITALLCFTEAKIIFHNFEVPTYSPLGILENKQSLGIIEMVQMLNARLRDSYKNNNRVFIFDYDAFCAKIGKENIVDPKMYYLGDLKVDFRNFHRLSHEYLSYIKPLVGLQKKCLVLDLDNTLWGGILGEDGLENIRLGPTPEGRPFLEFQKHLLHLFNRGVILALNSKNNIDEVFDVFKRHPYMVLRENHFASMKVNWNDKVSNMQAIAEELNIGVESLVFIDDDETNREMIKKILPTVSVVDLPPDPALYVYTLHKINDFNTLQWTEEDRERGEMYVAQRRREELKKTITGVADFFKSLNLRMYISNTDRKTLPRVAQLIQKTNQFNLTTKRYLEEQVAKFLQSKNFAVRQIRVEDKFGDYGLTGVAIIQKEPTKWVIDSFLLSCRVLGKNLEKAFMTKILEEAKGEGVKEVIGEFVSTPKNAPAKSFYQDCGFRPLKKTDRGSQWSFNLVRSVPPGPEYIEIIKHEKTF